MAAVLAWAALVPVASAGTLSSWTGGGGSGNWSTTSNWSTPVTSSGTFDLVFGGTTQTTGTNSIGAVNVESISFTNNGTALKNTIFTLSGSPLVLNNSSITATAWNANMNGGLATGDTIGMDLQISGSNTVTTGSNHRLTFGGNISGGGSMTYAGGGSSTQYVFLSGSNSYSGNTYVTGGSVFTSAFGTNGSNDYAFGGGTVFVSGSGSILLRNNSTLFNNLSISGTGALGGALGGSFGTAGSTATVIGGITLADDATIRTASTAGVDSTSKLVLAGPITLGSKTLTLNSTVVAGAIGGLLIDVQGSISGSGSVVLSATSSLARVVLGGSNSYTGSTVINTGTITVNNAAALGNKAALTINSGGLDLNGFTVTAGALSGSSSAVIRSGVAGPARLIVDSASNTTFAGTIVNGNGSAVVGLTKQGSGDLRLNGVNTYTGDTIVNAGTLGGSGSVGGLVSVNAGGSFDPGASSGATGIFGVGAFSLAAGGTATMQVDGTTAGSGYDQVLGSGSGSADLNGTLSLSITLSGTVGNGTTFDLFKNFTTYSGSLSSITIAASGAYGGLNGTSFHWGNYQQLWYSDFVGGQMFRFDQSTGQLAVVPEPGSLVLAVVGAASAWGLRRRRKSGHDVRPPLAA